MKDEISEPDSSRFLLGDSGRGAVFDKILNEILDLMSFYMGC